MPQLLCGQNSRAWQPTRTYNHQAKRGIHLSPPTHTHIAVLLAILHSAGLQTPADCHLLSPAADEEEEDGGQPAADLASPIARHLPKATLIQITCGLLTRLRSQDGRNS